MYKLNRAEKDTDYYNFSLKEGDWYGEDTETGMKIATSGWEISENVALYFLKEEDGNLSWEMEWVPNYCNFELNLENFPKVDVSNKMTFSQWLEETQGITYEDYDENYSITGSDALEIEYNEYWTNETPKFVELYAAENNIEIFIKNTEEIEEIQMDEIEI